MVGSDYRAENHKDKGQPRAGAIIYQRNCIMKITKALALLTLSAGIVSGMVSCTYLENVDPDEGNVSKNPSLNLKDVAVTGKVVEEGMVSATVEAYFNFDKISATYTELEYGVESSHGARHQTWTPALSGSQG